GGRPHLGAAHRRLPEPLESTTLFFGLLFAAVLVLGTLATLVGTGTVGGLGHAQVCVTDANIGGGADANPFAGSYAAKPGAQLQPPPAPLSACALHPRVSQRPLYSLMTIPHVLLLGGVLLLLLRVLGVAPPCPAVTGAGRWQHAGAWLVHHRRCRPCRRDRAAVDGPAVRFAGGPGAGRVRLGRLCGAPRGGSGTCPGGGGAAHVRPYRAAGRGDGRRASGHGVTPRRAGAEGRPDGDADAAGAGAPIAVRPDDLLAERGMTRAD